MSRKEVPVYKNIDEYIALRPVPMQEGLQQIREIVRKIVPDAVEVISYGMPAFKFHGMLIWFAAWKNHLGLYGLPKTNEVFKEKLAGYKLSKGTIQFPAGEPLPADLIAEIVRYRVKENLEKKLLKDSLKEKKDKKINPL